MKYLWSIIAVILALLIASFNINTDYRINVEYGDTPEIIESRGFQYETHRLVTRDGYILVNFRIVNPFINKPAKSGDKRDLLGPIILQSGMFGSADGFLLNSAYGYVDPKLLNRRSSYQTLDYNEKHNNLGFLLANLGYDVWLTNVRCNYYSRNHTTLDPEAPEFWATSFDEMAGIDLPTIIDYILKLTKKESVGYIGISRGTTVMFALLSEKPEYADKIKPFIAMAPAVYVTKQKKNLIRSFFRQDMVQNYLLNNPSECLGRGFSKMVLKICSNPMIDVVCFMLLKTLNLMVSEQINKDRLAIFLTHYPAGSPCWDIVHYIQIDLNNKFGKLDLGEEKNLIKYGVSKPPLYPLEKIKSNHIFLINSIGDSLIPPENVEKLTQQLKVKPAEWIVINETTFEHGHFLIARENGQKVNREIVRILSKY